MKLSELNRLKLEVINLKIQLLKKESMTIMQKNIALQNEGEANIQSTCDELKINKDDVADVIIETGEIVLKVKEGEQNGNNG